MANIQRVDLSDDKGLVRRVELERVGGAVEYRRFGPKLALEEQRAADPKETVSYAAWESQLVQDKSDDRLRALLAKADDAVKGGGSMFTPAEVQQAVAALIRRAIQD